jgi:desulfoferrodoxin (superoxide reductase-like protein)
VTRRGFRVAAATAVGLAAAGPAARARGASDVVEFEQMHQPVLRLPAFTRNGAKVPVAVELPHPMQPDHFITSLEIVSERDPVPSKGRFQLSPLNGQASLAVQIRVDQGTSEVVATAECNRHGRWRTVGRVAVPEGSGGCAGTAPPPDATSADDMHPPVIRIPQLVAEGSISRNQVVDVQLKIKHPTRTGLVVRDGRFVAASEPLYLETVEVFHERHTVCRFALTSALSDNPLIAFKLRAHAEGLLRAVLTNNRGQRFEATHLIRFS